MPVDGIITGARILAAGNVAARLLAGPWTAGAIAAALQDLLGPAPAEPHMTLVDSLVALAEGTYPPAPRALRAFLLGAPTFRLPRNRRVPTVLDAPHFSPSPPFAGLPIPALATLGELAAWLDLSAEELEWFADQRRGHVRAREPALQHYRYAIVSKSGGRVRLLEAPKPRLKAMQRRILREILVHVPVHAQAHGFVAGRSCLTGAQVHAAEAVVATFDLAQFFPSIGLPRIHGVFRSLGYPWAVARHLSGVCTTTTPRGVLDRLAGEREVYGVPHLPQGAPTSPALANLLAWRLDRRLHGLARRLEANYTRYADDFSFSGGADLGRVGFRHTVERIVQEEGFFLNAAKTRIMPRCTRQRITGLTVNAHVNVGRAEFDALKAILHNCARHGPDGQNRDGHPDFRRHLDGRVAWVEQVNPARGAKLRAVFERIEWPDD